MATTTLEIRFRIGTGNGEVSAILDRPETCRSLFVLGHGSGSNMRVPFISGLSEALVREGVATFRYEFPYSDREDFVPYSDIEMDEPEVLRATVRAAVAVAAVEAPDLTLFGGGHSISGLMTSLADAESPLPGVAGLVILGFPLKGDFENAAHLADVPHPMLFLQGTADTLGDVDDIEQVIAELDENASLHFVESAGHGFSVPNRPDGDVYAELAAAIAVWVAGLA